MINNAKLVPAIAAAVATALAATRPAAFSEGSIIGGNVWKLSYAAVAQPALSAGQHIKIQTDATHTDGAGQPILFHRFFTDPVNKTYFGYDLVVEPVGKTNSAIVKFQPLSVRSDQLPRKYASGDFKSVGMPRFPAQTFKSGQTIAVDVLENPGNGQKVVDYIEVAFVPASDPKAGAWGVAVADVQRAKSLGDPVAPVRLELYSDFECPACKGFHEAVLPLLVRDYVAAGKVYLVSREFPLTMHPYSREAANYATAAAEVGKYQSVGDVLFRNQAIWGASGKVWETIAEVLTPAEQKTVRELAQTSDVLALVQQDVDSGIQQRIDRTPTLIVSRGARRYPFAGPGLENYPILRSLIDELLK
ncbi:MAG TPA: thioredoxin domain-containing protein [Bryobacteraceae bacterium]|nr:thioredoxin domain-containing protein [Bryobacteraceae bacterium]